MSVAWHLAESGYEIYTVCILFDLCHWIKYIDKEGYYIKKENTVENKLFFSW